jgi:thioredoxin 1
MVDSVPELSANEFSEFIKRDLVLVDFFADWCMPCMMMLPIIEDISKDFFGKIRIGKVNVGEYPEIAEKYGVSSIPHFIFFKEGKIIEEIIGAVSQDEFEEKINFLIAK